jgi:hypothetical protein
MIMQRRSKTIENAKLESTFGSLRTSLLTATFENRLDKPLAFWVRSSDRGLPLALLNHSLRKLLATPFSELSSTPGVGQKKMRTFVRLLRRATDDPADEILEAVREPLDESLDGGCGTNGSFDADRVSDAQWTRWQDRVRHHDLATEKIGRLAPTLEEVPTVIWHTCLSEYADRSLDELRQLKNHGEKRVRVVLKVFHAIDELLATSSKASNHLRLRLVPQFVAAIEGWIEQCRFATHAPTEEDVRRQLMAPLLEQARHDLGSTIFELAGARLGLHGPAKTVQQLARQSAVTRARVYQLIEQCAAMMEVRWPEGRAQLQDLCDDLAPRCAAQHQHAALDLIRATTELFFPQKDSSSNSSASSGNGNGRLEVV